MTSSPSPALTMKVLFWLGPPTSMSLPAPPLSQCVASSTTIRLSWLLPTA
jgi:hypothetical protein